MGHSMVRPSYSANLAGGGGEPFFGLIFDPAQEGNADPDDLCGGVRAPRRFVAQPRWGSPSYRTRTGHSARPTSSPSPPSTRTHEASRQAEDRDRTDYTGTHDVRPPRAVSDDAAPHAAERA